MPLCSNAEFNEPGMGMVVRDIEYLYDRVVGTNDGNVGAQSVSQVDENGNLTLPLILDLGSGNTLTISPGDLAGKSGLDIRLREVSVCVNGVTKTMVILGSQPY